MNLLFIADPNSIHDLKKVSWLCEEGKHTCYILPYEGHYRQFERNQILQDQYKKSRIIVLEPINYFSVFKPWTTINSFYKIKKAIKTYKIDTLIAIYLEPSALWTLFKRSLKTKVLLFAYGTDILVTINSFFNTRSFSKRIIAALYKRALFKADAIAGTSNKQLDLISKLSGRKEQLFLIRTGVDISKINTDSTLLTANELEGKKYIFFPRTMRSLYNHELAISAITKLSKEIKINYTFVFIASSYSDLKYAQMIKDEARKIEDCDFCFLSHQSQEAMIALYKKSSLVVMTPLSDGAPVSAMEALSCKTPLILPPLDYDRDLFSEGVYIMKTRTPEELALTIEGILSNSIILNTDKAYQNMLEKADRNKEMSKLNNILMRMKS